MPNTDEWVYDFTISNEAHTFLANGIYVHNTATAEKDEYAEGGWILKAGALVLASGGTAFIDEFDKIEKEDRASLHEAMEQGSISAAKAGIVANFKANTSILAAANPKYGRFDSYKSLADQFDIPPTLLSRFDLIFTIRDIIDSAQDQKIAEHILKAYQKEYEKELSSSVDVEFLRKYIAYARKNCNPQLTKEAMLRIEEYYLNLRRESKETVQITPRQLEGLIRLSSASAKLRLSNEITIEDVERAIDLMNYSLEMVAKDETTGKIDVDRVIVGQTKTERDKAKSIIDIIERLTENGKKRAKIEDIIQEAKNQNIEEKDVDKIIERLKKEGKIYEPEYGFIMMIT
ncbi:MAG: ATP-binding protein [Candidatus Altarchaeaceae archaeon]